jgi:hypothetical protein
VRVSTKIRSRKTAPTGQGFSVVVHKVVRYGQPATPLYLIEYEYAFKNRPTVYVPGLGPVPPAGKFSYLCSTLFLEFRESETGAVLVKVPLKETVLEMGVLTAELAKSWQFSGASTHATREATSPFISQLDTVLSKYFHPPYEVCDVSNQTCVITTFSNLSDLGFSLPKHVNGEVALMVEYTQSKERTEFKVHVKALESRSHDPEWLDPETEDVVKDAGLFAEKVKRELQQP